MTANLPFHWLKLAEMQSAIIFKTHFLSTFNLFTKYIHQSSAVAFFIMKDKRRQGCSNNRLEQLRKARSHKHGEVSANTARSDEVVDTIAGEVDDTDSHSDTHPRPDPAPVAATIGGDGDAPVNSASRTKLLKGTPMQAEEMSHESQQWTLSHVGQINKCITDLLCPQCLTDSVSITITGNMSFSSELSLNCSVCDYSKIVHSSPRADQHSHSSSYTINTLMTVLTHELGAAHTGLNKIAKVLGMRNMHLKTYQRHDKRVVDRRS